MMYIQNYITCDSQFLNIINSHVSLIFDNKELIISLQINDLI